jgi:hypothetical protein
VKSKVRNLFHALFSHAIRYQFGSQNPITAVPTQACGKTRLVQAICSAVTNTQPTIVTYDGAEEFAKHIPVLLGKGDSAICIDNVIMPLNNAKLAALLTQENGFTNRLLGKSEDVTKCFHRLRTGE